ncbi:hypothetical protein SAMN05428985_10343 [Nocardioides sp. YR527]|uniref:hypothetical protein n=1 Tax=Nocardioides sp. YR527 TaxID=1881028 RepID=UPI00087DFE77|nr:hypothetical protein [Nocardioides sp. YR527]SDK21296.1 hypothetical protein SAMN05428985_10343 [Nocardioides sp. YR527]
MTMWEQLVLDIPGWEPLEVVPTPAMRRGEQSLFQCSWCGCVVVQPRPITRRLGACPSCDHDPVEWWTQDALCAGLREVSA